MNTSLQPTLRKEILLLSLDLAAVSLAIYGALAIRFPGDVPFQHELLYLTFLPLLLLWHVLIAATFGLYDFRHRLTAADHVFGGLGAALFGVGAAYLFLALAQLYYLPHAELSRSVAFLNFLGLTIWYGLSRSLTLYLLKQMGYRVRVVLAGPAETCTALADELSQHAPKLVVVSGRILTDSGSTGRSSEQLEAGLAGAASDLVIFAGDHFNQDDLCVLIAYCERTRSELYLHPGITLSVFAHVNLRSLGGIPLVPLRTTAATSPYQWEKRFVDVAAAFVLLLLLSPLLLLIAAALKATSNGPVFFVQERTGLAGASFWLYKFRTMIVDAEGKSGAVLSHEKDPRVIPLGRILRKYRIDELPQLFNVAMGHMSLVGPRPERPVFVTRFAAETPLYLQRLAVRPGLTGLAQIHGRYDTDYRQKLRYDLIYVNSISLATDLRILFATVQSVLTGKGAM